MTTLVPELITKRLIKHSFEINVTIDESRHVSSIASKGDLSKEGMRSVLEIYIRGDIGSGRKDPRKAIEKNAYTIKVEWHPENDGIVVESDTGNDSLTLALLMKYFDQLEEEIKLEEI
ncbi:MAG: hypothetical protein PHU42_03200 [Patescibacteria group bacterium]|nr:hypothetical protein [Patescibacteria group bacterium]